MECREIVTEDNDERKIIHYEYYENGVCTRRDVTIIVKKMPELDGTVWVQSQSPIDSKET